MAHFRKYWKQLIQWRYPANELSPKFGADQNINKSSRDSKMTNTYILKTRNNKKYRHMLKLPIKYTDK